MKPTLVETVAAWPPPREAWPEGCYAGEYGWEVRVKVGSGKDALKDRAWYARGTDLAVMIEWRDRRKRELRAELERQRSERAPESTLEGSHEAYLADAGLTPKTRKVRDQQLRWWWAQPAALGAPVHAVKDLDAHPEYRKSPKRLGLVKRADLDLKRIRQILALAFAPSDPENDPAEFANTSNLYRTALVHFFSILDRDVADAVNPMSKVPTRPRPEAQPSGIDMRLIAEILAHAESRFGRDAAVSLARLECLAWIHITPVQLMRLDPARDFHDVPEASREEIVAGAITVSVPPRFKGRRSRIAAPTLIVLNPRGVEAMRRFAALPEAHGKFSCSSLNKTLARACARATAALAKRGIVVDLAAFTLYHLKHSLSTAAQLASPGLLDRHGEVKVAPGLQQTLHHASENITKVYTRASVDPLILACAVRTARYLDALLTTPLRAASALKLVAADGGEA